jgi:hypothetical protein
MPELKRYLIRDPHGTGVAVIEAADLRYIERGVDFQPNLFNGYHAVELGAGHNPAVLNLPVGFSIEAK